MGANNKRRWWASTIAYPPGLACRPGGEAAKHITTIHIYPILLVWHADRERGKQPYTQQPSSWGLARGSSLVARGSWLVAPGPCLFVCVCAHALCSVISMGHGDLRIPQAVDLTSNESATLSLTSGCLCSANDCKQSWTRAIWSALL